MADSSSMNLYLFIFLLIIGKSVALNLTYIPNFTNIRSCDGFSNEFVDLDDLQIEADQSGDEASGVGLIGHVKIMKDIVQGIDVSLSVFRETETGQELMFNSRLGVCESLNALDTPWYALVQMMRITSCPVSMEGYYIDNFKMSLEPYSDVLTHDFCGEYTAELCLMKEMDKVSCHSIGIEIIEVDLDD